MTKKISVVIPAFNEEKFLGETLNSLKEQTFPREDFEIIVVDNASSDSTSEIARVHGADKIIYESRKGTNRARQTGLEHCEGRIVAFLDADCLPPTDWLEKLYTFLHEHREEFVAIAGTYKFDSKKLFIAEKMYRYIIYPAVSSVMGRIFGKGGVIIGGNFASFKKHFEKINAIDTSKEFFGDDAAIAKNLGKIGRVKFDPKFYVWSSTRRFDREGFMWTGIRYTFHYFKVMMEK